MKRRLVLWVFIGLSAATIVASAFIALKSKRSSSTAGGDTVPPSFFPESLPTVLRPIGKPVESRATLPSGLEVRASYHFNRNALTATALAPECVLALTNSGNLLRFDRNEMRLTHERQMLTAGVLLVHVPKKGSFVGCVDGAVFRIDPANLGLTLVARLSGQPSWMGFFVDRQKKEPILLAAVQTRGRRDEGAMLTLYRFNADPPTSTSHVLPGAIPPGLASAFFVDGRNQLWLGADQGEWGGWCARLDLNTDQLATLERMTFDGVYGFVGLPDGQVWAYGGMMHMGSRAFVARVDQGQFQPFEGLGESSIWKSRSEEPGEQKQTTPTGPTYPITHIIPEPGGGGLLVFAYADLFRTDFGLKSWRPLGQVRLRYAWGRPDAVASCPALKTVQALGGNSNDLLCATGADGLLRVSDGKVTRYLVDNQIGDDSAEEILSAADGNIVWASVPWKFDGDRWQQLPIDPPLKLESGLSWYDFRPLLDRDRNLVIVSEANQIPGPVAVTRWRGLTPEVVAHPVGDETRTFSANLAFATPDGEFWHTSHNERLFRLTDGKWRPAGTALKEGMWQPRAVAAGEPPWPLLGRVDLQERLFQLHPGKTDGDARLEAVPLAAELGSIRDAVSLASGKVLLATESGLCVWEAANGKIGRPPFAPPKDDIGAMCRDGLGRLWLAGKGVWIIDAAGVVHDLGPLSLPVGPAHSIAADVKHDDGVMVAIGGRGVLFIRAAPAQR